MPATILLSLCLFLSGCAEPASESTSIPMGTYEGEGANILTLGASDWSLRTGPVEWSGTYRVSDDRLILRTEDVQPAAGHGSDCVGAEEAYRWSLEGSVLSLTFEGTPCNQNRWAVLTSFPWMGKASKVK